ncbi:alpha-amylase family glycosyl hydrolase [Gaetbulibacter aquiaggeris]|uniref:Alpha-amylase family glycosyl hydrolase n=1 Tax=Gaetbulibacter aquiaggeris TaxID=1735373 RepID=A0ABW7MMG1_9FLAO
MKKLLLILSLALFSIPNYAQISWQGGSIPEETNPATILFDKTGTGLESYSGTIYAHTGVTIDDNIAWQNVIGTWGNNATQPVLELVSGNIYKLDLTSSIKDYYSYSGTGAITAINMVLRSADGLQQTGDLDLPVGAFQLILNSPAQNSTTLINSGESLNVSASNTGGNANYVLTANGTVINTQNNTSSYTYTHSNITQYQHYELQVTLVGTGVKTKNFDVLINQTTATAIMPTSYQDGITYLSDTEAVLVLYAPGKDYIYVAGSFNNWQPNSSYAMKYDFTRGKHWITLSGLTSGQIETYQYWVVKKEPSGSALSLVKVADPYSTLILDPNDDQYIPASTYPNLPAYPSGQKYAVSVLQTNQAAYNWQVSNFNKPKKEDLVVYEVLLRDFDADRNFQDLIDRISYFKNLNINAIELMPVMEFEGNESWGYNTSFHLALDKYYGTKDKFKELVDVCHQNGIAVILDLALNHAFGQNSMVRMWNDNRYGDSYGEPTSENPYFNTVAKHTYSVGNDFNHQRTATQNYTKRVIKQWIEEFKIDGFRWDLTKGFTQNCTDSNYSCTDSYQADRVAVLKSYADYSWSLDPNHYVIFEHLGSDAEEQEWANYKINEGKGVMMWSEMWNSYKELANGNASSFDRMGHVAHGFTEKRTLGYPESHDKDRIMYEMTTFGKTGTEYDIKDLNTALARMSALGAVTLTIPGPKMLWHFADLGMDDSIWLCSDGVTVNSDYDATPGDCKLSTKPQPQWSENWLGNPNRKQVYDDWSRLIQLKTQEAVFEGDYTIDSGTLTPKIYIFDDTLPTSSLKNVVILANFDVIAQNITPNFPYPGTWYDLMDETGGTSITVSNTPAAINLPAGAFKIYGNKASTLSVSDIEKHLFAIYPNPTSTSFKLNNAVNDLRIYNITGKMVKSFNGNFQKGFSFNVSNLNQGIYIIKIKNQLGQSLTSKLVKL